MSLTPTEIKSHLKVAIQAALKAGEEILKVYSTNFNVEHKDDRSPLTQADKNAHEAIKKILDHTGIPVLSEEGKEIDYSERKNWKQLWIVDPLDGTKEFIKKNGEFTVNIALVENEFPVAGVVYVPVSKELFYAAQQQGAYKYIIDTDFDDSVLFDAAHRLTKVDQPENTCRIVASRSHMSEETEAFIALKKQQFENVELVSKGSSLKFCLVAEGAADCYPRYAPTMEWDTAAGQIIVEETGKKLMDIATGERMRYNREQLLNGWFLVE